MIYSKITQDIDNIFIDNQRKNKNKINVEILNILIALKKLGDNYLLTEKRILNLFNLDKEENYNGLNYFQVITILYYIENDDRYSEIKINIEKAIINKYDKDEDTFAKSELVLLFFDIICCPFISERTKRDLIKLTNFCKTGERIDDKIKEISIAKKWFVDWDTDIDLERILKKKEWGSSY